MIKIRYSDLPAGLHARVERRGRSTIIYLLPGLTAEERRTALRRARRSASMGYGPALPLVGFAAAVLVDRLGSTLRNGAAAVRGHPALLLLPAILVLSATSVYVMTTAVSINIPHHGHRTTKSTGPPRRHDRLHHSAWNVGQEGGQGLITPSSSPSRSPRHHRTRSPQPTSSASSSPTSTPTPGPPSSPSPSPTVPPTVSPGPPTSSPSSSPSSGSNTCVTVGSSGACLTL